MHPSSAQATSATHTHLVGDLRAVCDLEVPGLRTAAPAPPDLRIDLTGRWADEAPEGPASPWYEEAQFRALRWPEERCFEIRYPDGCSFVLDEAGTRIWARWPAAYTLDDAASYLTGPILGIALRLRGRALLHASAVISQGRAVALVGPAGAGKSTTALGLALRGAPLALDDLLVLGQRGEGVVGGGSTRVRLWPDAGRVLYGGERELPALCPSWDKRFVEFEPPEGPLPLSALYLLGAEGKGPVRVEAVPPAEALMDLLGNGYPHPSYRFGAAAHRRQFEALCDLAGRVPVRRVVRPGGLSSIPQVCDAVLDDVTRLLG
jgi:hypothetical protein